jgi:hypothetical protein
MIQQIVSHKFIVLCLSILAAIPFLFHLPDVKTVDNVDYFTIENDPDVLFYDRMQEVFGNDEFFIIAFQKENLFTPENLHLLKNLTEDLAGIKGIRDIKSLANVIDTIGEQDFFYVEKFLQTIPEDTEALEALRQRAVENPLYSKNFISEDGNTAAIVISVHKKPDDPGFRKKIITRAEAILEQYKAQTGPVHMAGWTYTNLSLSQYMKKDIATFIPITYIFIALAVFLFFGNLWLTLIAVVNISLCMGATMGLFPMLGITLNNVTTIVAPVVMALALCDTVHIFSWLNKDTFDRHPDKRQALAEILKKLVAPCFLTTLTTAVGFLSLYLSDIPPIRQFALIASAGMVFEFFFAFTFMPAFMLLFTPKQLTSSLFGSRTDTDRHTRVLNRISQFVFKHFRAIFATGILALGLSVWLSFQIPVETNLLEFFKSSSPVRRSSDFVETHLAGVSTLDISFKADDPGAFKHPENLAVIQALQRHVDTIEGVDKTLSFVDFIKDMHQSFHNEDPVFYRIPDRSDLISQYLLIYESDDIRDFVNNAFDHARLSIRMSRHTTSEQAVIIKNIRQYLDSMETRGLDIRISGRALQDVNTIDALVKGQVYSLAAAAAIIIVIMFFVLRSFSLGMLSILPNLFPIVLNFGIMGLFSIPLNTATALIAAVAIGVAVDDTIHFLTQLKRSLADGADIRKAIHQTIQVKGRAIILSSLILSIGFGVMVFSSFVPTINFGALSAVIMVTAALGDILLLPAAALVVASAFRITLYKHKGAA